MFEEVHSFTRTVAVTHSLRCQQSRRHASYIYDAEFAVKDCTRSTEVRTRTQYSIYTVPPQAEVKYIPRKTYVK